MEYFKFLPVEIAIDILSRLPTDSALDSKLVSKAWRSLVRHPSFSKLHLQRLSDPDSDYGKLSFLALTRTQTGNDKFEYFEYHENNEATPIQRVRRINVTSPFRDTKIVGSCNGLVCLSQGSSLEVRPHCICNPITREYVVLSEFEMNCDVHEYIHCTSGFGYVSSTNEYKVVGVYISKKTKFLEVHIYTLGSGLGWRNLGDFNYKFRAFRWQHRQAIFANGALYWLNHDLKMINTFGLAEEIFRENLSPPPLPLDGNWFHNRLGVLDGVLFYAIYSVVEGAQCFDVWLLKKRKDNHDKKDQGEEHQALVWSKEFRVYDSEILAFTKGDGVLCLWDRYLNFYDTKASTSKWLVDLKKLVVRVLPHKNTFVSLKVLGEEGTAKIESVQVSRSNDQPLKQL